MVVVVVVVEVFVWGEEGVYVCVCVCVCVCVSITNQTGSMESVELAVVMKMGCKVQLRDVVTSE